MGSLITKINDDHEIYVAFCEMINEKPLESWEMFYEHQRQLMKKHNYERDGCFFKKIKS